MSKTKIQRFGEICEGEGEVIFFRSDEDMLNQLETQDASLIASFALTKRFHDSIRNKFLKDRTLAAIGYSWKRFPKECGHLQGFPK